MSDAEQPTGPDLPEPEIHQRKRWHVSWIWLVPLVAALVGISMLVHGYLSAGPTIVVSFQNAEGIEAGKTEVKYKNVVIGKVHSLALSKDRSRVLVRVDLNKDDSSFASKGSRFWVVRPRIGLGGVSGLGTLFSGSYIGADTGGSNEEQTYFKGLEMPPPLTHNEPGTTFDLHAQDLGSLDIGSPVYFRRIQVGRVVAYHLDKDGKGVDVQVFVSAPNDRFVSAHTHFWNASGVNVSVGANGLTVNTESLATVVVGGVAFQQPPGETPDTQPARQGRQFKLFDTKDAAMTPPDGPPVLVSMRFRQSVRGLSVGSPVDFEGITLGQVKSITLDYDPKTHRFPIDVVAVTYPQRMGKAHQRFVERAGERYAKNHGALLGILIKHGLRAQLRNGNLLTGQQYVALDFMPNVKPNVKYNPDATPLQIPTATGSFDRIQSQLSDLVNKMDHLPLEQIGNNLNASLRNLNALLGKANTQIAPQLKQSLDHLQTVLETANQALGGNSPLRASLRQTLQELQRAARSLRSLSDYLSRHPESLIRGRHGGRAPASSAPAAGHKEHP